MFGQAGAHSHPAAPEQADTAGLLPDTLTDRGSAKLFASLHSKRFRHVPGLGWYQWSGSRWQLDENECVLWAAGEMAESLALSDPSGAHTAAALRLHRRRALSTSGIRAMLVQARSAPGMVLSAGVLDADPYVLCTPAGVVDLRSGVLRVPDPDRDFH
ncbi:DNA primase, partial [Streptomyces sp. BE308]|nr:DNA primase [Streptomyces sp. BE308]